MAESRLGARWGRLTTAIRSNIALKLLVSLIGIAVPLLLASIWISYSSSISLLDSERASSESRTAYLGASTLENYFRGLDSVLLSVFSSNRFMTNIPTDPDDFYNTSLNESFLRSLLYADDEIQYVYFYAIDDGRLTSVSNQLVSSHPFPEAAGIDWIKRAQENRNGLYIGPPGPFVNYRSIGTVRDPEVFMMSRRVFDIETDRTLGVIALAVSTSKVRSILSNIRTSREHLFLYAPDGRTFIGDDSRYSPKITEGDSSGDGKVVRQRRVMLGAEPCLVSSVRFAPDFEMVTALPISEIHSSATKSFRIGIAGLIVLSVALLVTIMAVVYPFVNAIKRLAGAMREATDSDFRSGAVAMPEGGRIDEIGTLHDGFVAMMERIDHLINLEYRYRMESQEAQLRALQSQIDPHFINNTLQSIGTLALRHEARDVYDSLIALSRMIGYTTDPSRKSGTIGEEVEQVRRYVGLQTLRFGTRLRATFDIPPETEELAVPPLILQPVVENSIVHGLEQSRDGIDITVSARVKDGTLTLRVVDTGRGMTAAELTRLKASLGSSGGVVGEHVRIGLRNVAERVRLFSRGRGSLAVDSREGAGTTVTITLPAAAREGGAPCTGP